jgi:hypothetical protein
VALWRGFTRIHIHLKSIAVAKKNATSASTIKIHIAPLCYLAAVCSSVVLQPLYLLRPILHRSSLCLFQSVPSRLALSAYHATAYVLRCYEKALAIAPTVVVCASQANASWPVDVMMVSDVAVPRFVPAKFPACTIGSVMICALSGWSSWLHAAACWSSARTEGVMHDRALR